MKSHITKAVNWLLAPLDRRIRRIALEATGAGAQCSCGAGHNKL